MSQPTNNYAFIDAQNLYMGVKAMGWKLDYKKFRLYLKNKHHVTKAYMFFGYIPGNNKLYSTLQSAGYNLVFKPVITYAIGKGKKTKGNVDTDLTLQAIVEMKEYDKAVIVSCDGDYLTLIEHLVKNQKLEKIIAPSHKYSSLLRGYAKYITVLDNLTDQLSYNKKTGIGGRSKP